MSRVSRLSLLAALALFARTSSVTGEEPAELERRANATREPSRRVSAWTSFRIGVVDAPYPSATLGEVRSEAGQARLFRLGAAARVAKDAWVGAHAAYVSAGVEQPAGSYRAGSVWGNPLLFALKSFPELSDAVGWKIDGDLSLSIGVPIAAERGNPYEQLDRRALAIGNALEGMMNPESFTPDVFPSAVGGSLTLYRRYFQVSLGLELPLLVRLSSDTIPDGAATSAVGFIPNGEVQLAAWPWSWFGVSLGTTVAWPVVEPVYVSSPHSAAQIMLVPRVSFALGDAVLLALDVDIALGGPASGTASAALSARLAL